MLSFQEAFEKFTNEAMKLVEDSGLHAKTSEQVVLITKLRDALVAAYGEGLTDGVDSSEDDVTDWIEDGDALFHVGETVRAFKAHFNEMYRAEKYTIINVTRNDNDEIVYTLESQLYKSEKFTIIEGDLEWTIERA